MRFQFVSNLLGEFRRRAVSATKLSPHIDSSPSWLNKRLGPPDLLARRRGLPVIIDSMRKPYSSRPLCVAVKQRSGHHLAMQLQSKLRCPTRSRGF